MMAPATISALRPTGRPAERGSAPRPRAGRTTVVPRAGFLDFMIPKPGGGGGASARGPARSAELVEQLLELSGGTDAGLKASPSRREEIDELVSELAGYCMRSPLRSDLIFGEWEVVYASKPQTAGGPFRSPLGRTVFPGQRAVQVISEPNICVNEVSYKTLGFIPGAARQEGEIEPVNETTFQITFPGLDANRRGAGGPPQRLIEVVYLDEKVRVARAVPQDEGEEGSFYVFARVGADTEEEEEEAPKSKPAKRTPPPPPAPKRRQARAAQQEEEEEVEKPARKAPAFNLFPVRSPAEGRATMAERAVARAGTGSTRGTQRLATKQATQAGTQRRGGTGTTRTAAAATTRKTREELAAERAAAAAEAKARAEEQRRARAEAAAEAKARMEAERVARAEAAAAARAKAEEERRAKAEAAAAARAAAEEERRRAREAAEAERAAAAQRQAAAKEAYASLAEAATEAADEAREAATAYKAAEKEAAALIRAAGQARGIIERAVAAAEEAAAELVAAQEEEVAADKDVLEGQRLVNALEKRLREVSAAVAPRIKK